MIYVYILLIIIAIGYLLSSEEGQKLLGNLSSCACWVVLAGLFLFLGYLGVILTIFLLSDRNNQLFMILGYFLAILIGGGFIALVWSLIEGSFSNLIKRIQKKEKK